MLRVTNQFDGRTLKAILDFIYKGKVEVTPETAASLLIGAQVLEIKALEELCCTYMIKNLDVSHCLGISQFAKLYNFDQLNSAAVLFACENFVALTAEEEYLSLSLEGLCELISKDDLRVACEGDVLRGILAWINHEKEDREQHFEELLSFVRFPLLSPVEDDNAFVVFDLYGNVLRTLPHLIDDERRIEMVLSSSNI